MAERPTIDYTKWLPIGIAALALVVSLGSAVLSYVSFSTARQYSEINIRPHLDVTGDIFAPPKSVYYIINKGRGPAFINKVEFLYDGKPHTALAIAGVFLEAQRRYNAANKTEFRCRFTMGEAIDGTIHAGESAIAFTTEGDCPRKYQWEFFKRLKIEIEYESLSGKRYDFSAIGDPSKPEIPFPIDPAAR